MKFLSIELAGYKRTMLSGVNYIKLTPTEDVQLILGSNGSGKSSLLNEITPLPSNANDYIKEGFSVKTIKHNGSLYVLKSSFSPKQEHSFIKDDVEMNQGRTVSVQKELVRQEFAIDAEIHELIMGRDKFTRMSPMQRRYWLTQLSSVNYDYAIGVYNKLKERLRDTSGAIKLNKNRLVTEMSKMISTVEQEVLKNEVNGLHEFLAHILEYRKPTDYNMNELHALNLKIEAEITKYAKTLIYKINRSKAEFSFGNAEHVAELLVMKQSKEQLIVLQLDDLHNRIGTIQKSVEILEETGNQGVEQLREKIKTLMIEQRGLWTTKSLFKEVHKSPIEAIRAHETISDTLTSICSEIAPNADKRFSRESKNRILESLFNARNKVAGYEIKLNKLNASKKHFEDHKNLPKLECPKCKHSWITGYDPVLFFKTCEELEQCIVDKASAEKEVLSLIEENEELDKYFSLYRNYTSIVDSWNILEMFWIYIKEKNYLLNNPRQILLDFNEFKSELLIDKRYLEYDQEIAHIQELILAKQRIGEEDVNKLKNQLVSLEEEIYTKNQELTALRSFISRINTYIKDLSDIDSLKIQIDALEIQFKELNTNMIETLRRQHLNEAIRKIQSILSRKEAILSEVKSQNSVIESIAKNIEKLEQDEKCLKAIVSELSPTDGLIAEGLFSFIKVFLSHMNSFIKKVWSYPLIIQSCHLSDESKIELDYKFPMKVGDDHNTVPDVSKGSTGIMEIVDLAFKVTAIKFLGLSDIPLFLDEFGASFDHQHRTTAYGIFDYLINQINFSQVFLVNHYNDLYGSMKNAEICILHDANIIIPKGAVYNKHVVLA